MSDFSQLDASIPATSSLVAEVFYSSTIIMGNDCFYLCSPCQEKNEIPTDTMREVQNMQNVEDLIAYIDQLMSRIDTGGQEQVYKHISVASSINSGGNLIEKLSKRLKWPLSKKCLLSKLDRQTRKVLSEALSRADRFQFVGMALSVIAHLLERAEQASSNNEKRLHLLRYMSALAKHMKNLTIHLERRQLDDILTFIVKATVICALQMQASSFCRFMSAPLDEEDLQNLESQLVHSYHDLEFQALTTILDRLPTVPHPSQGEYPHDAVGIEESQNKVIQLLNLKDSSRRVVVIYGVGGIGKTTLATAVFNSLDLTGYHHCRVDMERDSKLNDLKDMQEQILRDLFKENLKLNNCTQGRGKLLEAFGKASKPVFLFIDNALRQTDLEMLLPIEHLSNLPIWSRILLTTRSLDETNIFRVQHDIQLHSHRVDSLSETEAKRLLCHYALGDKNGSFDTGFNVNDLLQICGRIPLVLKMVGFKLRTEGNTVLACNEILDYLKEWQRTGLEGGGEDLSERMVDFVYRRLTKPSQEAFLDIAAFFYEWERSKVGDIVGETQLQDLERAALVTISEEDKVNIHDIVRARGRKLSEGNRITDLESLVDLLGDDQKLKQTKGIWLRDNIRLETKHVDLMSRSLRVLSLGKRTVLDGRCERAFEELRFLDIWYEDTLPIQLSKSRQLVFFQGNLMKGDKILQGEFTINLPESSRLLYLKLLYLDVDASYFPALVRINGQLTSVRELQLSNINLEYFDTSISQLKSLHSLLLLSCGGFTSIPESLGNFSYLKILKVDCSMLERLPKSFGNLCSIRNVEMRFCSKLDRLPESFGNLSSMRELDMSDCSMLERLPESFGNLSSLQRLCIYGCSKLETLPESFGNLSSMRYLNMRNCFKLEKLPESFGNLSSLQELDISDCSMLERLPGSFVNLSSLHYLNTSNCCNLENLPESFGNLSSLQMLCIYRCSKLERLPESFGNLSSLQILYMSDCPKLERLPQTFDQLSCLNTLKMDGCENMCSLFHNFGQLKCLKFLSVSNCRKLKSLPDDIVHSTSLAAMKAYGCTQLEAKAMDSLVEIKSLMFLEMGESPMLIKRWEQIQQHRPLIGAALRFQRRSLPFGEIMSTMFFNGGSKFLHVDGDGKLAEVGSALFPDVGVKVGLLLTACPVSHELRQKLLEVASPEFQIIYVDVDVEGVAEGSKWMEERDKRIKQMLLQLPEGSRAWTPAFRKSSLLFGYSLWRFTGYVDTSVVGTSVVVDEEGRRQLSHPPELMFRTDRRVQLRTLFSPLSEAWELMRYSNY